MTMEIIDWEPLKVLPPEWELRLQEVLKARSTPGAVTDGWKKTLSDEHREEVLRSLLCSSLASPYARPDDPGDYLRYSDEGILSVWCDGLY
jgi:hypothetical protein